MMRTFSLPARPARFIAAQSPGLVPMSAAPVSPTASISSCALANAAS
jgi:hypothetical protein